MVRIASAALFITAVLASLQASALGADVRVQGSEDAIRVEARDATGAEILAALAARFALSYRGATASERVSGTFEGPLNEIVKRVLDGYNFVISRKAGGLEVVVISRRSNKAVPPPRPIPRGRQE
jgi:hypothetical protein